MRRSFVVALVSVVLLGLTPVARGESLLPLPPGSGDGRGTPGQLPIDLLAPKPLCDTETGNGAATGGSELRIGTYNVLHTQDPDGRPTAPQRIGMLAAAIKASGADVLGLQEVAKSDNLEGSGLMVELIAQDLAASTGNHWHWCWFASNAHVPYEPEPNPGGGGGPLTEFAAIASGQQTGNGNEFREGVALLSRYPIKDGATVQRLALRAHEAAYCEEFDPIGCQFAVVFDSRVIMHGVIDGPDGEFDLYTTHIAHGVTDQSDDTKQRHINEGLEYIDDTDDEETPTYYVGDFNSNRYAAPESPGRDRYDSVLDGGFFDLYTTAGGIEPGFTGGQDVVRASEAHNASGTIDFVFGRNLSFAATAAEVIGTVAALRTDSTGNPKPWVWPSDHFGVVVTVGPEAS